MIGAAHSLSAHVVREIQRGGREQGALGHSEGCGLERGYGDPSREVAEVEVAGGPAGKESEAGEDRPDAVGFRCLPQTLKNQTTT